MQSFIHEDFLLTTPTARVLYHEYAENEPILDYHCHLSPKDVAENRQFQNLFEIWLEGDHYKWRALRAHGISEEFCTGNASPYDKFLAWARTVPYTLRNPLYHWTHLELKRYFGIDELLNENTAHSIWERANAKLAESEFTTQAILRKFRVTTVCTTDDPTDDLRYHAQYLSQSPRTSMYPAFRPDKALAVDRPDAFRAWVEKLESASGTAVQTFADFLAALKKRHAAFHALGCRLSDHGLSHCYADLCEERVAAHIFRRSLDGIAATPEEHAQFASYLMLYFGQLDAEKSWTKQLHLGAIRNSNSAMLRKAGPDTGFDTMGDWPQALSLAAYMDRLKREGALPKLVIYNNNPSDNYVFATMIGNFQDGSIAGKIQFGSGWWFLDQKHGIEAQLEALSNCGMLAHFVGMLTDSRSFMSYPRHEYFRRVLCNLLGKEMESGELPDDIPMIGSMIRNICYANAKRYFGLNTD